jgi:hypothetical protein
LVDINPKNFYSKDEKNILLEKLLTKYKLYSNLSPQQKQFKNLLQKLIDICFTN